MAGSRRWRLALVQRPGSVVVTTQVAWVLAHGLTVEGLAAAGLLRGPWAHALGLWAGATLGLAVAWQVLGPALGVVAAWREEVWPLVVVPLAWALAWMTLGSVVSLLEGPWWGGALASVSTLPLAVSHRWVWRMPTREALERGLEAEHLGPARLARDAVDALEGSRAHELGEALGCEVVRSLWQEQALRRHQALGVERVVAARERALGALLRLWTEAAALPSAEAEVEALRP